MSDSVIVIEPEEIEQFAKALHSPARREILRVLRGREMNVNQIARETGMSQSATVTHIQALERARLLTTRLVPASKGVQKVCTSVVESAVVLLGSHAATEGGARIVKEMPVGLFFDHEVRPTCGLATDRGMIGFEDNPASFVDPRRAAAQILWFEHGYVEYRLPLGTIRAGSVRSLAVSVELCSEFPGYKADWPSDITVWLNGVEIGTFRSPGDPGDRRGHLNPAWWPDSRTQYGFLKEWRVTREASFIDGEQVSEVVLDRLELAERPLLIVRFGIKEDAEFRGGVNLFGSRFGNHPQDIRLTLDIEG